MAWTDPAGHVWAVGEIVQAGSMNTYLKDNLLDLDRRATLTSEYVPTAETTTSTAYTDLTTVGPQITVTAGGVNPVLVCMYSRIANNTASQESFMSFEISGVTVLAADDTRALSHSDASANIPARQSAVFSPLIPNVGGNTFTAKYRVAGGTGTFTDRRLAVIPLG